MSRLSPHTLYAEDQPLAKTMLTTHVMHRMFQSGSGLGILVGVTRSLFRPSPTTTTATIIRSTAIGALIGTAFTAVALSLRMRDQTKIQWQDRAWRLLENQGQLEVDDWSLGGAVAGAVFGGLRSQAGEVVRWKGFVGGAGVGSVVGVAGYMAWRYSVRGGKR